MITRNQLRLLTMVALSGVALGCNFTQEGEPPAPRLFNFPVAIEMSPTGDYLLVANSNFDLRYNTGTLQTLDLNAAHNAIGGCTVLPDSTLGECAPFENLDEFIVSEVGIGSHVDGIALSPDGDRVYLPVRADRNLTFIDFDPTTGALSCDATFRSDRGPEDDVARCSDAFRSGREGGVASERMITLNGDPVEVVSGRLEDVGGRPGAGDFVLMPLRNGRVALFIESMGVPELVHIAVGFPPNLVTLTMQPGTGVGWMTAASTDQVARVGVAVDRNNPLRSFVFDFGGRRLGGVDDGDDTRDFQFHPTDPDRAYVLSRRPESVVEIDLERTGLSPLDLGLQDIYEVGAGPSRLAIAQVGGRTYAIASCFDARKLFFIDVDHGALVSVTGGLSGPFAIVVDQAREYLYITDFSVSVVRFVDLSPLATNQTPVVRATFGRSVSVSSITGN